VKATLPLAEEPAADDEVNGLYLFHYLVTYHVIMKVFELPQRSQITKSSNKGKLVLVRQLCMLPESVAFTHNMNDGFEMFFISFEHILILVGSFSFRREKIL
jgi:hypothetical protein